MKTVFSLILILGMLIFAGCGKNVQGSSLDSSGNSSDAQTQPKTLMDKAELRAIAYQHAGVTEADVRDIDEDWENRTNTTVYELDFEVNGVEYEYGLDGYTGEVIYSNSEGAPELPEETLQEQLTEEEAKNIALTHAELTEDAVTDLRIELDREDNDYEIEFRADGYEYDYEIDIFTGDVLKAEKDRD